jgi:hypothetical protein
MMDLSNKSYTRPDQSLVHMSAYDITENVI